MTSAPTQPAGLPPFRAIPDLIRENALARPAHLALRHGDQRMDWGTLATQIDRVAAKLQQQGLQPTQSIAISGSISSRSVNATKFSTRTALKTDSRSPVPWAALRVRKGVKAART